MNTRLEVRLWAAQRISAMVLGLCVLVHLITIIVAMHRGLTAAEILGRTQGSVMWAGFYLVFVIAVAVHAPIGLRTLVAETLGWRGRGVEVGVLLVACVLAAFGLRAIWAVFA